MLEKRVPAGVAVRGREDVPAPEVVRAGSEVDRGRVGQPAVELLGQRAVDAGSGHADLDPGADDLEVDLGGDPERRVGRVAVTEVGLQLLGQAEQVLVAARSAARGRRRALDESDREPARPRRRLVDGFGDRAHSPLGDALDEGRPLEHLPG
jgi:hypothetical protein